MTIARTIRAALTAAILIAGPALAQAPAPAATPAPAAPAAAAPTEAHLKVARDFTSTLGLDLPISEILNETRGQLIRTYTTTRPEIAKDLEAVLNGLLPEIAQKKEEILTSAVQIVAANFSESELTELSKFFNSPLGVKYQAQQPLVFQQYMVKVQDWQRGLATVIITRVREEMKKKGHNL